MTLPRSTWHSAAETIVIEETGLGPFSLKVTTGSSTFYLDEPLGAGGLGSGPNPYDLLSAALGASTATTLRIYATHRKWPLEKIRVRVSHQRMGTKNRSVFSREIVLLGALDEAQQQKLLQIADASPVQQLITRRLQINTVLVGGGFTDEMVVTHGNHMRDAVQACEAPPELS
jgi:putative redox protein